MDFEERGDIKKRISEVRQGFKYGKQKHRRLRKGNKIESLLLKAEPFFVYIYLAPPCNFGSLQVRPNKFSRNTNNVRKCNKIIARNFVRQFQITPVH